MTGVTAIVITFNEAAHIEAALDSLAFADEIIVVDSQSTDDTVSKARRFTDKVIVRPWPGYVAQKNFAAEQAATTGSSRSTPTSACRRRSPTRFALGATDGARRRAWPGFASRSVTFHLGRWLRSTDWYPDYQLRLYDRRRARWSGRPSTSRCGRTARSGACMASSCTTRTGISPTTC